MNDPKVQIVRTTATGSRSVALLVVPELGWVAVYDCHAPGTLDLDMEKYAAAMKYPVGSPSSRNMTIERFADELLLGHIIVPTGMRSISRCDLHPNAAVPARDCPKSCYEGGHVTAEGDTICAERRRANDTQVGGTHYVRHGEFQPWDAWWLWRLNAFQGAVVKYVVRYREKGGVEDLRKAVHYLEKLIECEEAARAVPEGQAGHDGVREGNGTQ